MTITCATCGRELESVNKPHDDRDHKIFELMEKIVEIEYYQKLALQQRALK